jgi:hypothetical protein
LPPDRFQQPGEGGVLKGQRIAIGKKNGGLPATVLGGELQVRLQPVPGFYRKNFFRGTIGTAEGAAVVRTSDGCLKDDGKGLAGRTDDIALIIRSLERP